VSEDAVSEESGSGKVFLVLGLLVGLGLGAGGGFYYFGGSADETTEEEKEAQKQEQREPLTAIAFDRIAVPIYATRGNSRRYIGHYFIDLDVNVRGAENQITVKRSKSQLQHSFVSVISKQDLMREDSPTELDVDKAAKLLTAKATEVLGAGIVESVSIRSSMRIPT
jgi:flagellar basal body-associated protein FliL